LASCEPPDYHPATRKPTWTRDIAFRKENHYILSSIREALHMAFHKEIHYIFPSMRKALHIALHKKKHDILPSIREALYLAPIKRSIAYCPQ
jgi:hypothetical protein